MRLRQAWSAALVCVAALVVLSEITLPPAAAARRLVPHVALDLDTNGGGNRLDIVVRVRTGRPRIECRGTATQGRRFARLPRLRTGARSGAQWHWFMGDGAPRAKLTVRVRCRYPDEKVRRRTLVRTVGPGPNERHAYRSLMRPGSLRTERWVPPSDDHGSGGDDELYPSGQCTWWVHKLRPDLPHFAGESGDAKNWIESARAYEFPIGTEPRPGAVAVFRPGQYGAGIYGHVAYVLAADDKRMTITEANFQKKPVGSRRTISWDKVRFIYRVGGAKTPPPGPASPPAPTVNMTVARASHTATRLADGRVLVAGGRANGTDVVASAELFEPSTKTWAPISGMTVPRIFHTATLLADGKVLVTGGQSALGALALASAELFDPATNTWKALPDMRNPRLSHVATLLANRKVLVTGGQTTLGAPVGSNADLFDPATNTWTALPNMPTLHASHTATLLADGDVLVAGGDAGAGRATAAAQLFHPASNTWAVVPNMPSARAFHAATLLPNRWVLVTGGDLSGDGSATAIADLYDPSRNMWVRLPRNMTSARMFHTATLLANQQVLVAGGQSTLGGSPIASAELYDPANGTWTPAPSLGTARVGHRTTLLESGAVLVTGGDPSGKLLVTGGESSVSAGATAGVELYPEFGAK